MISLHFRPSKTDTIQSGVLMSIKFFAALAVATFALTACQKANTCSYNAESGELACVEKVYKTVNTGNHIWMAENLARLDLTGTSHCYGDSAKNCEVYGSLYPYETATKICPDGWTLPTKADFEKADMGALNVVKAGFRYYDGKSADMGVSASFWTADDFDDSRAVLVRVTDTVVFEHFNKSISASLRCIKK